MPLPGPRGAREDPRARELYTPAAAEVVASAYREDFAYLKYCATFECIQRGAFD